MIRKARAWLLVGLFGVLAVSCARLDRARQVAPAFQFEAREGGDAIPLSYGEFVAVTPLQDRQYQVILWFAQTDDRIVGVRMNVASGVTSDKVLVIPRR